MLRTLGIEWMKIRNYRTFWILLGIIVISIPAFNYMFYRILGNTFPKGKNGGSMLGNPFSFPDNWHTITWFSSLLFILQAILVITLTTNEFTFKTHRQNIIDGWSRSQYNSVKLIGVLILSVISTIVVLLTVLGFGFIGSKAAAGVSVWQGSRFLWFYFVQVLSYSMIAYLLAVLIKRSGLAIGLFLIYMIVEQVVMSVLSEIFHFQAATYLPEETTDRLIPFPLIQLQDPVVWEHRLPGHLIVAAIYLVIYCGVTGRYFLKSDL